MGKITFTIIELNKPSQEAIEDLNEIASHIIKSKKP
jgi:hypothetical protein